MRFAEYAAEWKAGQRDLGPASVVHPESLLNIPSAAGQPADGHLRPQGVEGFIRSMEHNGVGLAAQANAFDKLKAVLLDANRLGLFDDNPVAGIKPPQ
ncbi:hypothetical protein [Streptomyces sp. NPDC002324]